MRRFKWIEWNLYKIAAHHLSPDEVESAFERVLQLEERSNGSFQMFGFITTMGVRTVLVQSNSHLATRMLHDHITS